MKKVKIPEGVELWPQSNDEKEALRKVFECIGNGQIASLGEHGELIIWGF